MSGYAEGGAQAPKERDPLLRFLAGCAIVVGSLAVIVIGGCGFFAWRLVRDETPGRPVEGMLVGDESHYWRFDLKPDDAGLLALFARFEELNNETRRRALENTPFKGFPMPTRRADVHEIFPLSVEASLGPDGTAWAARATLSKGGYKVRAGLKLVRWMLAKDSKNAEIVDVDGVQVTVLHERGHDVAFTTVGDRVIASGDVARLRRILATTAATAPAGFDALAARHEAIALSGEDGWAFAGDAVASFDFAEDDSFRVRVAVPREVSGLDALSILEDFLPGVPWEAVTLDEGFPRAEADGSWRIEGRISGLAKRLGEMLVRSASAIPIEPSLPPTSGPRSDTPGEPPRGESPSPAR